MQHKKSEYIQVIIAFADDYRDRNGFIPTMSEIADGVGLSVGTICKYIAHMREHGIIDYEGGQRTITTKRDRPKGRTLFVFLCWAESPVVSSNWRKRMSMSM